MTATTSLNFVDRLIDYENGELSFTEEVELFQDLLDSTVIYSLQGVYFRRMQTLIDAGHVIV